MRVRLQDVARKAEVSMQTVSRVIRTPHLVAPETAARVKQVMEELGYVKNEQATALRLGRARTIGLLMPLLADSFWSEVAAGAEFHAHERGYSSLLCDISDPALEEEYIELLLGYQVTGIIYAHPHCRPETHPVCAMLIQSGIPVVVISVYTDDLPYDHVRTDDKRAGYVIARHLLDLGHRHINIVTNTYGSSPDLERVQGVYEALREYGMFEGQPSVFVVPHTYEGGFTAGLHLLDDGHPRPGAVFCTADSMTFGLLEAFRSRGVRIPEDIVVASHDGLHTSAFVTPPLTTVAPRARTMGVTSVDKLLDSNRKNQPPEVHMVEADLLVRASTIGTKLAASHTFSTPISDPTVWSRWRTQSAPVPQEMTTISCLTFEQVFAIKEEG